MFYALTSLTAPSLEITTFYLPNSRNFTTDSIIIESMVYENCLLLFYAFVTGDGIGLT